MRQLMHFLNPFPLTAAHLLQLPKSPEHLQRVNVDYFKINSLQLRGLFENYVTGPNEPAMPVVR